MWILCYRGSMYKVSTARLSTTTESVIWLALNLVLVQVFTNLVLFIPRPQPKIESRLGKDVTAFAHAATM